VRRGNVPASAQPDCSLLLPRNSVPAIGMGKESPSIGRDFTRHVVSSL